MASYIVWYKWSILEGVEKQFLVEWDLQCQQFDFVSWRLHKGTDGCYHLYTKWESRQVWEVSTSEKFNKSLTSAGMRKCIAHSYEPLCMKEIPDEVTKNIKIF